MEWKNWSLVMCKANAWWLEGVKKEVGNGGRPRPPALEPLQSSLHPPTRHGLAQILIIVGFTFNRPAGSLSPAQTQAMAPRRPRQPRQEVPRHPPQRIYFPWPSPKRFSQALNCANSVVWAWKNEFFGASFGSMELGWIKLVGICWLVWPLCGNYWYGHAVL